MMLATPRRIAASLMVGVLFVTFTLSLASCGGAQQGIVGKWEGISGSAGVLGGAGTIIEFFKEGTVNLGMFSGSYSWPDNTHLKIEIGTMGGMATVYEASLQGDELTLTDSSKQVGVFKRYKILDPSIKNIAGEWHHAMMDPDESGCVKGLGANPIPDHFKLGEDGSFRVEGGRSSGIISLGSISMNGNFSINGNRLRIQASGTDNDAPIQGEFDCQITLSHSRLEFKDDAGKLTLYHR